MTIRLLPLLLLLLVACSSKGPSMKDLEILMESYAIAVRWGDLDGAWEFVDPETRKNKPLTGLERERLQQFQVAGYEVKRTGMIDGDRMRQMVEIRLINRNTQIERIVVDDQVWRWEPEIKRWWLVSGIYDPTKGR